MISLDVTVDESSKEPGKALVNGLKNNTTILGTIFDKEKEAKKPKMSAEDKAKAEEEKAKGADDEAN